MPSDETIPVIGPVVSQLSLEPGCWGLEVAVLNFTQGEQISGSGRNSEVKTSFS